MRGFLKVFALISFIGECISALGTVYPQWEQAYNSYKQRKEALKTPEERAAEAAAAAAKEEEQNGGGATMHMYANAQTEDATYVEVKQTGTNGGGQI